MTRRESIDTWLMAGLAAVEPAHLVRDALADHTGPLTILAIGKAAAAMCRGAADAVGQVDGLCISSHEEAIPAGIELMVGGHPFPSEASLRAGLRAQEIASHVDIALISGGGSSLCEVPADGLTIDFMSTVNQVLLASGVGITDINLVRTHLSRIKGGRLGPIPTYVLSDVPGAGPEFVSSGPTIATGQAIEEAISVMRRVGITVDEYLEDAMRRNGAAPDVETPVEVVGDGRTAARAIVAAVGDDVPARVRDGWLVGDYSDDLNDFVMRSRPGVTVAAGEPSVRAEPGGSGGRNTHAALTAAQMISGSDTWFAALATDGVDGSSRSAGAIVDGTTIQRGGDPSPALLSFDSATYLGQTGDLIETGPTGTNVADLWLIWN